METHEAEQGFLSDQRFLFFFSTNVFLCNSAKGTSVSLSEQLG